MESSDLTPSTPSTPLPPAFGPATLGPYHSPLTDLDHLGDRIARLSAQISAATFQLLVMVREFDERGGWEGFRTCAHWLSWRTGLALGAAREKVRVAKALAGLPGISQALSTGEISYSKVRALTRVATEDNEGELLGFARAGTASHVESVVQAWRRCDRMEAKEREAARRASRYLQIYTDDDGMVVLRGRLEPEAGAVLAKALEAAEQVIFEEQRDAVAAGKEVVPVAQRRADAIARVAEAALETGLDGDPERGTRADRYQVVVHVDASALEDPAAPGHAVIAGTDVPAGTSRRIACDASKVVMTHDSEGRILDVGRKTRAVSPALRRALAHRDKTCRFPGCHLKLCDAHHVEHWAQGGETKLENLILLCRTHHRYVHEEGYSVEPGANGEFDFTDPRGRPIPQAPPLPEVQGDTIARLVESLTEAGVDLEQLAYRQEWDGTRLDLSWAVDALRSVGRGTV